MDGGDVSSTATDDEVPRADPELPPTTTTGATATENDVAFLHQFGRAYGGHVLSVSRLPLGGRGTIFFVTRSYGDGGSGDDPAGHGGDADNDDDAYGGLRFGFGAVPASGVAIACLPETTVGVDEQGEARERGEYAVCLEEYAAGDALRTMPCAHGFHKRCIFEWLRGSRLCPLCRFKLPPEEGTETDDDEDDEREAGHDDNDGDVRE